MSFQLMSFFALMLQQNNDEGIIAALFSSTLSLCCAGIFALILIAGMWKIFDKAGKPGWAAIVPIYNIYILMEIIGRPGWWVVLFLIPFVNVVVGILASLELAASFGKSVLYGVGMIVFPYIFYPLLGFGDAQYKGPAAGTLF